MRGTAVAIIGMAAGLGGCVTEASWPDRQWLDAGCQTEGPCTVGGTLRVVRGVPDSGGVLTLDDGSCLPVALPEEVIRHHDRWNGRRVAIRGRAIPRGGEASGVISIEYGDRFLPTGLCSAGVLVLYADRLSLRAAR